jgi:hypothetical protein
MEACASAHDWGRRCGFRRSRPSIPI